MAVGVTVGVVVFGVGVTVAVGALVAVGFLVGVGVFSGVGLGVGVSVGGGEVKITLTFASSGSGEIIDCFRKIKNPTAVKRTITRTIIAARGIFLSSYI